MRRKRQRLAAGLAADADSGALQLAGHPSAISADAVLTATKADRLERNRAAAAQCRQRKKQYIKSIEDELVRLRQENATVRPPAPAQLPTCLPALASRFAACAQLRRENEQYRLREPQAEPQARPPGGTL